MPWHIFNTRWMCTLRTSSQRQGLPVVAFQGMPLPVLQLPRQVCQIDEFSRCRDARAGNNILQLTNVPWPGVAQQHRLRAPRQSKNIFPVGAVVFLQEKLHQQWNVLQPLRQRGNADLD